jgi:glycine/D-amino acid oxidase-like deaminating enzyme
MGYSSDGFPLIGNLPGKPGQYLCAGFSGHGMPQVFLSAKAIASMVIEGTKLEQTDLPQLYRLTKERLESTEQHTSLAAYDSNMKAMKAMQTNGVGP